MLSKDFREFIRSLNENDVEIEGVRINFIDGEDLKKNKIATGRSQDLADAENLS